VESSRREEFASPHQSFLSASRSGVLEAPVSPAPTSNSGHKPTRLAIPQLDTMRFFAFFAVFLFHTVSLGGGNLSGHTASVRFIALAWVVIHGSGTNGVGLFFVLSAYLITEILRRERNLTGTIDLRLFYTRRILRIWPLYFLVVGLGLLWQFAGPDLHLNKRELLTYIFFVKNWDVMLHGWNWNPIYILWTVSAEEQFYVFWPLAQKLFSSRLMLYLCVAAAILIPALLYLPGIPLTDNSTTLYLDFIFFPIGGILSFVLNGRRKTRSAAYCLFMAATGIGLWLTGGLLKLPEAIAHQTLALTIVSSFIVAAGTVLIFLAFLSSPERWSVQPLTYLGRISYGLYVYHIMVFLLVRLAFDHFGLPNFSHSGSHSSTDILVGFCLQLPIAFALTIAVSALSYEYFERPFLKLKQRFAVVPSGTC
jgi:peptidoglycan/LPS O-acetylase OafA/YrhL